MGFDIGNPYVEQCWSAVVGPSATLLMRRLPHLWQAQVPAQIEAGELSRSLGLGAGAGQNSRLVATMGRLARFGLARPSGPDLDSLDVYLEVSPLQPRQLERLPEWTRAAHERLFGAHIEGFAGVAEHRTAVAEAVDRLDMLRRSAAHSAAPSVAPASSLGR